MGKTVSMIAAAITRSSRAFHGAEKQEVQPHCESEQNSTEQQPLCPCHRSRSSFVLDRDPASLMPLREQLCEESGWRVSRKGRTVKGIRSRFSPHSSRFMFPVAFCYRAKNQTVAGHPRSTHKEPMMDGVWTDKRDKFFDSITLLGIRPQSDQMAPALLIAGDESDSWEVT